MSIYKVWLLKNKTNAEIQFYRSETFFNVYFLQYTPPLHQHTAIFGSSTDQSSVVGPLWTVVSEPLSFLGASI